MKSASTLIALLLAATNALPAPIERDERDVLRSAEVYQIMAASREPLDKLGTQLRGATGTQLLEKFKRLARAHSSDPGSASSGGDMGLIVEGTMDEKFDAAVFAQTPMKVSSPQPSAFGWHLILVTALTEVPIKDICRQSLLAVQQAAPITPDALFRFSLEPQAVEKLHPAALGFIGEGWGAPLNWDGKLAYMRVERNASASTSALLVIHAEFPFARYTSSPQACRRSARDTFEVDCAANKAALVSHVEYEGRGASGRRLLEFEYAPAKRVFQAGNGGLLGQVTQQACAATGH